MAKNVLFHDEARNMLFDGVKKVADAVSVTLGPKGRLVVIENPMGSPTITKDGVTVAKSIELENREENLGASLLKEVASKTNEECGDGTTTSTVLAYAITKEGMKAIASGVAPVDLKKGMECAKDKAIEYLKEIAKPIKGTDDLKNIANISANNDSSIGDVIAEAIEKVGKDGIITVGESSTMETTIDYVEGMQFDRGMVSPYFVTDRERMVTEFKDCYVMITDKTLSSVKDLVPLLNSVSQSGHPLLIVCEDCTSEALMTLVANNMQGNIRVCVVKAPYFGDTRKEFLNDLCILTGAEFISDDTGVKLTNVDVNYLGMAKSVKVDKNTTTIVDGCGDKSELEERIKTIQGQIENTTEEFQSEKLRERLAKLSGGVAVVNIGAKTEVEMTEKKHRVEDTLSATRSALEEGIVCGGGNALVNASLNIEPPSTLNDDEKMGFNIVKKAMEEPMRKIYANAGYDSSIIISEVKKAQDPKKGVDIVSGELVDFMEKGVVDPVKVTHSALENAVSVASLIIMTETSITTIPKETNNVPMMQ